MTPTTTTDRPTYPILCSESTFLAAHDAHTTHGKPTWVSHPTLEAIITSMRAEGRTELVHYAGASWRDDRAWQLCGAWLTHPQLPESELKAIVLRGTPYELTAAQIRAANPGMR